MPQLNRYRVLREHGEFSEGQTRDALASDVAHFVPHILELVGPLEEPEAEKSEAEPENKAERAAPANKADRQRASKGR